MLGSESGSTKSISRFWGTSPNILGGGGRAQPLRLAKRYKTPCSNRGEQLEEARAAIKFFQPGTQYLPDLPI